MISCCVVVGVLKEQKGVFRYIESTGKNSCFSEDDYNASKLPLLYWTRDESAILMSPKEGTFVVVRGRIESDKEIGLYVLVEQLDMPK